MQYIQYYNSPMGKITLLADELGFTGLLFENEEWTLESENTESSCPAIDEAKTWLNIYFAGNRPDFTPAIHMKGSSFQEEVWKLLLKIPYGEVTTYGDLAKQIAANRGISRMSAQAVGGAVGSNPISIIVPCHRVVGTGGNLTGYASGLDNKITLLKLEKHDMEKFYIPTKGTAL